MLGPTPVMGSLITRAPERHKPLRTGTGWRPWNHIMSVSDIAPCANPQQPLRDQVLAQSLADGFPPSALEPIPLRGGK